ncbi:MAG: CAP domain-containing protein [Negativicutes bacterium]|nr:CAP domain-containing protein [Negativicutes bacterium]
MKRTTKNWLAGLLVMLLVISFFGSSTLTAAPQPNQPTDEEQLAFELLNADRQANGLYLLSWNPQLAELARAHAQDMQRRDYFSHDNPEGQSPFDRMRQRGIKYRFAGENLASNSNVEAAEIALMNSPGHRANILNSHFGEVGIGVCHDNDGSVLVVQEFIGK